MTGDGTHTYHWGAEDHLTVAYLSGTALATNTYNALGQRVRDVTSTETTDEAYGAGGELLWRYTGGDSYTRAFVLFQGGILAEYYSGGTLFDHPDELGSISTSSDRTGNNFTERLFHPFGELWTGVDRNNFAMHQTFAERPDYDAESDRFTPGVSQYKPNEWC